MITLITCISRWSNLILVICFFPWCSLPFSPYSYAFLSVRKDISSFTMLFPEMPIPYILPTICPNVFSEAMFLIVEVLSFIPSAISPCIHSEPMHIIILPFTRVAPPIRPRISSLTIKKTKNVTFPSTLLSFQSPWNLSNVPQCEELEDEGTA